MRFWQFDREFGIGALGGVEKGHRVRDGTIRSPAARGEWAGERVRGIVDGVGERVAAGIHLSLLQRVLRAQRGGTNDREKSERDDLGWERARVL